MIHKHTKLPVNLIKWTGIRRKFTKDEIMDEFSLIGINKHHHFYHI